MLISIFLGLTGLGCSTLEIPDLKNHINLSDGSAVWFTTNTRKEGKLTKPEWDKERVGYACFHPKEYAKIFKLFERACQRRKCEQETIQGVLDYEILFWTIMTENGL